MSGPNHLGLWCNMMAAANARAPLLLPAAPALEAARATGWGEKAAPDPIRRPQATENIGVGSPSVVFRQSDSKYILVYTSETRDNITKRHMKTLHLASTSDPISGDWDRIGQLFPTYPLNVTQVGVPQALLLLVLVVLLVVVVVVVVIVSVVLVVVVQC